MNSETASEQQLKRPHAETKLLCLALPPPLSRACMQGGRITNVGSVTCMALNSCQVRVTSTRQRMNMCASHALCLPLFTGKRRGMPETQLHVFRAGAKGLV